MDGSLRLPVEQRVAQGELDTLLGDTGSLAVRLLEPNPAFVAVLASHGLSVAGDETDFELPLDGPAVYDLWFGPTPPLTDIIPDRLA